MVDQAGRDTITSRLGLLEKRVRKLEELICETEKERSAEPITTTTPRPGQKATQEAGAVPRTTAAASGIRPLSEKEFTACMALKELRQPSTVEEINQHLAKTRFIKEAAKETLLLRLKGAVEKGVMAFDPETKKFSLKTMTFIVE